MSDNSSEFPKDVELKTSERLALRELSVKAQDARRVLTELDAIVLEILSRHGVTANTHILNALDADFTKAQIVERKQMDDPGPDRSD